MNKEQSEAGQLSYRNFTIYYDPPPIPIRSMDYHYHHDGYDGAEDSRHGSAASIEACKAEIDDWYDENDTHQTKRNSAMICKSKNYTTRGGYEARVYATMESHLEPVHGAIKIDGTWTIARWSSDGQNAWCPQYSHLDPSNFDLTESDPHGVLPHHRELLASVLDELQSPIYANQARNWVMNNQRPTVQAALIALAQQEEKLANSLKAQ